LNRMRSMREVGFFSLFAVSFWVTSLAGFFDQNELWTWFQQTVFPCHHRTKASRVIKVVKARLKVALDEEEVYFRASFFQTSFL
jgi:hypothetical protein